MSIAVSALLLSLQLLPVAQGERVQRHMAQIPVSGARQAQLLLALDLDLVEGLTAEGAFQAVVSEGDLERLARVGFTPTVVQRDLESFYAARLAAGAASPDGGPLGGWLSPPFAQGSMGGYYTFAQLQSVQDQLRAAFTNSIGPRTTFGTSIEGRPMQWQRLSDNPLVDELEPEARFDALHHAREPEGMQTTLWFMLWLLESYPADPMAKYIVENRELYFVPCVNPDGYVYNQTTNPGGGGLWRKNRRNNGGGNFGIDLNRNYNWKWGFDNAGSSPDPSSETYRGPSPASEPEIAAMQAFFASRTFQTTMSVHTFSNLWMSPYGYDDVLPGNNALYNELSALMTATSNYVFGPIWHVLYPANGTTVDYDHDVRGSLAWTAEIGNEDDGFWPPQNRIVPLAEENLLGFQRVALAAGAWVRKVSHTQTEVGDGDGFFEAGEKARFVLTLKNNGRAATTGGVTVALTSASPWVALTVPSASLGAMAASAQTSNAANPLELQISAGAPGGTGIAFQLELTYEGWTQSFPGSFVIGEPRLILSDDVELNWGWTMGVAGDTATTGKWARGNPIGTSSGGQPANPEDDFSPAPGVQCFVTGNGGGAAGDDDVDNGVTTLLSPVFDLSHVGAATLSYGRWYADLSVADDQFAVSISNNGGASWVPLESLATTQNSWNLSEFNVESILPQTDKMRLRFVASDQPNNSLVEAAVDELSVRTFASSPRLLVYGTPALGGNVLVNVSGPGGAAFVVQSTLVDPASVGSGFPHTGLPLSGTVLSGTLGPAGNAKKTLTLPASTAFAGRTIYFRAAVSGIGGGASNWDEVKLP
jgi:carboxypeptidase T